MSIYLNIDNINGNVTTKGYENEIDIYSFHFSVNRPSLMQVGDNKNRTPGHPGLTVISISKKLDCASNHLFELACNGQSLPCATFTVVRTGKTLEPYAKYILYNVMVAEFSSAMHAEGTPLESIKLSYTKLETHYLGEQSSPKRSGFNLQTAQII